MGGNGNVDVDERVEDGEEAAIATSVISDAADVPTSTF